jgi:hypothetical protein
MFLVHRPANATSPAAEGWVPGYVIGPRDGDGSLRYVVVGFRCSRINVNFCNVKFLRFWTEKKTFILLPPKKLLVLQEAINEFLTKAIHRQEMLFTFNFIKSFRTASFFLFSPIKPVISVIFCGQYKSLLYMCMVLRCRCFIVVYQHSLKNTRVHFDFVVTRVYMSILFLLV